MAYGSSRRRGRAALQSMRYRQQGGYPISARPIGDDLANVNRWRRQLQLSPIQFNELSTYLSIQKINEYDVKIIRLHHQTQSFLIYWFNFDSYHLFVKVISFDKIIKESFDLFVENQAWDRL